QQEALGALGALGDEVRLSALLTGLCRFCLKRCQDPGDGDAVAAHATTVHMAHRDWEEAAWRELLEQRLGMSPTQIQALLQDGVKFSHGVIMVPFAEVSPSEMLSQRTQFTSGSLHDTVEELENQGLLPYLQQKYMTALANPRWLLQPIDGRGRKDIFQVNILQHLILFGQEACPDWALKRKVTERPDMLITCSHHCARTCPSGSV
ncbi:hypothetical protein Celaphus_00010074, partial [Cervus elaphus hippelaphus]